MKYNEYYSVFYQHLLKKFLILLSFSIVLYCSGYSCLAQESNENLLVSAYIERFTRFIENKKHSDFDNPDKEINFYIIGNGKFNKDFESIFATQKIKNKKVNIKIISKPEEIIAANLVFVNKTAEKYLDQIVEFAQKQGILTISYSTGFAGKGIHINLFMLDSKLKFEINNNSAREAGFNISHLLLTKSVIVE